MTKRNAFEVTFIIVRDYGVKSTRYFDKGLVQPPWTHHGLAVACPEPRA
jgi:hypothetical protein